MGSDGRRDAAKEEEEVYLRPWEAFESTVANCCLTAKLNFVLTNKLLCVKCAALPKSSCPAFVRLVRLEMTNQPLVLFLDLFCAVVLVPLPLAVLVRCMVRRWWVLTLAWRGADPRVDDSVSSCRGSLSYAAVYSLQKAQR